MLFSLTQVTLLLKCHVQTNTIDMRVAMSRMQPTWYVNIKTFMLTCCQNLKRCRSSNQLAAVFRQEQQKPPTHEAITVKYR